MPEIKLCNITKRWKNFYGVDNLNMTIEDNAFVTLLGPSGCGKTTTLRMIAGLETPTSGQIKIGKRIVFDSEKGINIPASKRKVGFLFQNYALWPNMTVYQNISFGLKNIKEELPLYSFEAKNIKRIIQILNNPEELINLAKDSYDNENNFHHQKALIKIIDCFLVSAYTASKLLSFKLHITDNITEKINEEINKLEENYNMILEKLHKKQQHLNDNFQIVNSENNLIIKNRRLTKEEIDLRVREVSRIVKIGFFMDRYPNELSGGQQQRVAIARTLAPEPEVLFMDEPLSNLDAKLRLEMRSELKRLHLNTKATFVYVTHDQLEAMTLATKIALQNNGVLQQYDSPLTIYENPKNLFVADFVGNPGINFIDAKTQITKNEIKLSFWNDKIKAKFIPNSTFNLYEKLSEIEEAQKKQVIKHDLEKSNKDTLFNYKIFTNNDFIDIKEKIIEDDDLVIGVRPEFIEISDNGILEGEIYSSMPTGMETTLKILINDFIITGVVFGNIDFNIGTKIKFNFKGDKINLFSRKYQSLISLGQLEIIK